MRSRSTSLTFPIVSVAVVLSVFVESPVALAIVLTDGLVAAGVIVLAALPGMLVLRLLGAREPSRTCRFIFGAGVGIGILALLELTLGLCGHLDRAWWLAAFGAIIAFSLPACARDIRRFLRADQTPAGSVSNRTTGHRDVPGPGAAMQPGNARPESRQGDRRESRHASERRSADGTGIPYHWLWLAIVPFAALTLLVATAPPGTLWQAEGNGYDVLEYHLAAPKEYLQAGRIHFLPHNVYANFPANAEMLYLLAMVLRGDAIDGIELAQMFNALLAFLTIAAIWAAGRPNPEREQAGYDPAPALAALLAATCGWLVYLSGVAYVENAMLLFTSLGFGAWLRWKSLIASDRRCAHAWALAAGLFAGLACGCKYTAILLVALPLGIGFVMTCVARAASTRAAVSARPRAPAVEDRQSSPRKAGPRGARPCALFALHAVALYCLGSLVTFAPWLARNAVFCGNPIFPLATKWLGYRPGTWDESSAERWERGHRPPEDSRSLAGRTKAIWHEVIAEPRTGIVLWLLAPAALLPFPRRRFQAPVPAVSAVSGATRAKTPTHSARRAGAHGPSEETFALETAAMPRCSARWPLAAIVILQLVLWAGLTHLVGRFAVPILPPLILLAAAGLDTMRRRNPAADAEKHAKPDATGARADIACATAVPAVPTAIESRPTRQRHAAHGEGAVRARLPAVAILLAAALNLYHTGGLYYHHSRARTAQGDRVPLNWFGTAHWFVEGQWPGTEHLGFINRELPDEARLLMVADARTLYVRRRCDYCVVFNPNPLATAVRETGEATGVLAWLRNTGYTHVYVDWREMKRLRDTYGFWPEIDEGLFTRLERVGLRRISDFAVVGMDRPYGTIFEVPQ